MPAIPQSVYGQVSGYSAKILGILVVCGGSSCAGDEGHMEDALQCLLAMEAGDGGAGCCCL